MKLKDILNEYSHYDNGDEDYDNIKKREFEENYVSFLEEIYPVLVDLHNEFNDEPKAKAVSDKFKKAFYKLFGIKDASQTFDYRIHRDDFDLFSDDINHALRLDSTYRDVVDAGKKILEVFKKYPDIDVISDWNELDSKELRSQYDDQKELNADDHSYHGVSRRDF